MDSSYQGSVPATTIQRISSLPILSSEKDWRAWSRSVLLYAATLRVKEWVDPDTIDPGEPEPPIKPSPSIVKTRASEQALQFEDSSSASASTQSSTMYSELDMDEKEQLR